jgi:sec-independent protein translocase protein TatC
MFYWANEIYIYLAEPLTRHLPEDANMIAIDVASPFLTPFKLVLMLAVFLAMPVILYQMWAFVAPGLYANEKRIAGPLLVSSILLFYAGVAFAYYVVFPLVFGFFTSIGPEIVNISTDIGRYLDFVLALFFGFGLAFEVPIATIKASLRHRWRLYLRHAFDAAGRHLAGAAGAADVGPVRGRFDRLDDHVQGS